MATTIQTDREPIIADELESAALADLLRLLGDASEEGVQLVGPDGESVPLSPSALKALRYLVEDMARGDAVSITPIPTKVSTHQAANLLRVSLPYLTSLLEKGEIPFTTVDGHQRIQLGDLVAFQQRERIRQREALRELSRLSQEMGLYQPRPQQLDTDR